jgi:hypothetical protein
VHASPWSPWQRTDDHAAHVACFTGMSPTGASLATLCVTVGSTATKVDITARTGSGNRILKACRSEVPLRTWTASARSAMRDAK